MVRKTMHVSISADLNQSCQQQSEYSDTVSGTQYTCATREIRKPDLVLLQRGERHWQQSQWSTVQTSKHWHGDSWRLEHWPRQDHGTQPDAQPGPAQGGGGDGLDQ